MELNQIETMLPQGFYKFLARLEQFNLSSKQKRIARARVKNLELARGGAKPQYNPVRPYGDWQIVLPDWLQDQRNQMTGPANDPKLSLRMVNSHSPGVMLDLEDSLANTPDAILNGHAIAKKALYRELTHGGELIDPNSPSVTFLRVRGLHMGQIIPTKIRKEHYVSASLFDLAMHFWDLDLKKLKHPPCIYIPKSESMQEATWWKNAFTFIEGFKKWPRGTIKCMALVESHPLAYQMEEFAYLLQPYLVGLNLGRWDYMASLIDFNYDDPDWLFPDRNSIPTDAPFFQNLRHRMAQVCHAHGLLAIGGMTALFPNRKDKELNDRAMKSLRADKENEAACLMDGAWTGHPDQNAVAVAAFPEPNQICSLPGDDWWMPDLREFNREGLPVTEEGTREAIRTCIQYRQGVIEGKGAKLINGYMEDLATDRIYRVMLAQRLDHGIHTEKEMWEMFEQEISDYPNYEDGGIATWKLIKNRQFNPR